MTKLRSPSTDRRHTERVLAPDTWPIEDFSDEEVPFLLQIVGAAGGAAPRETLRRVLADPERVRSTLRALPGLALVLLEVIAESAGSVRAKDAVEVARLRTGAAPAALEAAVHALERSVLVVQLMGVGRDDADILCLVDASAEQVARAVIGITLPGVCPPETAPASSNDTTTRHTLVIAGLTGHRRLRYNLGGGPNRGQLKRFGKALGVDSSTIERHVVTAERTRLLGSRGEMYAPIASSLRHYARGELPHERGAHQWSNDWVSLEALAREQLYQETDPPRALWEWHSRSRVQHLADIAKGLEVDPYFESTKVGDHVWLRARRSPATWSGDGHVTPNLEVMLGPAATLELVAVIALACEATRIDRLLTFRITRASITAGLASGLAIDDIRRALAAVSDHPVPANVERTVDDWAGSASTTTVTRGWVLTVAPTKVKALVDAFDELVTAQPAPGIVVLAAATPRNQLNATLTRLGISVPPQSLDAAIRERDDMRYGDWTEDDDGSPEPARERGSVAEAPALPLVFEGDAALRDCVEEARTRGFPTATPARQPSRGDTSLSHPERVGQVGLAVGVDEPLEPLATLEALHKPRREDLRRWAKKLNGRARAEALEALQHPSKFLPWILLSRQARRETLSRARSLETLVAEAEYFADRGQLSPDGARFIELQDAIFDRLGPPDESSGAVVQALVGNAKDEPMSSSRAEPAATATGQLTPPDALAPPPNIPAMDSATLRARLVSACENDETVHLRTSTRGKERVVTITPAAIVRRGNEDVLHALTLDGEGRVFRLAELRGLVSVIQA